jgi:hypothetical protein
MHTIVAPARTTARARPVRWERASRSRSPPTSRRPGELRSAAGASTGPTRATAP